MKLRSIYFLIVSALLSATLYSCDDTLGEGSAYSSGVTVELEMPDGIDPGSVSSAVISMYNLSNGQTSEFYAGETINVIPGIYDVTYSASVLLANGVTSELKAVRRSVTVTGSNTVIVLKPFNNISNDDFIISEIFFAGTLQPSGNQYYGDDYVKIYNNTDHVLYADGLTLFESRFTTTEKYDYTPDIMDEAVTVHALYTIPGSGKDHPVQPGEYILLADTGIDHRQINANSFDLSHADWEWYDVSTKPSELDIDSPLVPNLDKMYCYTLSFLMLHNRGFKCYGLARIPVGKEEYLRDYKYTYSYVIEVAAGTFPMSQSYYKLPNEWVVDAVNCSVAAKYAWTVCAPRLDMGWTYCGTIDKDKTRYFHSVRRKLLYVRDDGTPVFKDTNNSSEDFNPQVTPSEIELQHTATDVAGLRSEVITYDGVTPVE